MDVEVAVIGGSFAGLAATLQLVRARRKVLLVDAGKPRNRMAPIIHGMPGHDGKSPAAVRAAMFDEVQGYPGLTVVRGEAVAAAPARGGFSVKLSEGGQARAAKVILATGVIDDLPPVPGLAERWGKSIFHCPYCHGFEVAGRRIAVLGALPESLIQALMLPDWSEHVTLLPDGRLPLTRESRQQLAARGVAVEETAVTAIEGAGTTVEALRLADGRRLDADVVYTLSSTRPASPLAAQLGCGTQAGPFGPVVTTDAWRQTSVPGVHAAGDMAGIFQTATLALADGVTAAVGAHHAMVLG